MKTPVELRIEWEVLKMCGVFEGESRTSLVTSLLSLGGRGVVWVLLNPLIYDFVLSTIISSSPIGV